MVADDRRAFAALRPVAAGRVAARGGEAPLRIGAGQDVVHVHLVAAAWHRLALLGERGLLVDVRVLRMQILQVFRDHRALRVVPGAFADALARAHPRIAARQPRAQVRLPVRVLRAHGLGERVAMRVRAFDAAEIGAVALAGARHEERHVMLLRLRRCDPNQRDPCHCDAGEPVHGCLLWVGIPGERYIARSHSISAYPDARAAAMPHRRKRRSCPRARGFPPSAS